MKTTKRFLILLLTLCLCVGLMAVTASASETSGTGEDGLSWSYTDGTLTITGTGEMGDYSSGGRPWWEFQSEITTVVIGEGVTSVGSGAFSSHRNLTSITLPSTLTTIGEKAFYHCTSLTAIPLPEGLTTIGEKAFQESGLTSVDLPDSLTSMGKWAFAECPALTSATIGTGLSTIPQYAFAYSDALSYIYIPANIRRIDYCAFYYCSGLTEAEFEGAPVPKGGVVTTFVIKDKAFAYCDLVNVYLPERTSTIDGAPFEGNRNLEGVWLNNNYFQSDEYGVLYQVYNPGPYAMIAFPAKFSGSYTIPDTVEVIYPRFTYCSGLTSLTFGEKCGGVWDAFYGCTSLTEIVPGAAAPYSGASYITDDSGAFILDKGSSKELIFVPADLTEYTVAADVTDIDAFAFTGAKLENIYVAEGNTKYVSIDGVLYTQDGDFLTLTAYPRGRSSKEFTIPEEVTYVGSAAFVFCEDLTITFPGAKPEFGSFTGMDFSKDAVLICRYPADREDWSYLPDTVGDVTWVPYSTTEITKQPTTQKVKNGTKATFAVEVSGSNLTYQWQYKTGAKAAWKNCTANGNKTATMKVPATNAKSGYRYRCVITDGSGAKYYSNTAYLYVLGIKTQPVAKNVKAGVVAKFTVSAAGHNKTYQWQYKNAKGVWVNATATGAKTATLKVTAKVAFNGRQYRCVIKDSAGNKVISNTVKLTVFGIKTQPTAKSVKAGNTAKFTVAATGSGLKYQWQYKNANGKWVNCTATGAKTATMKVTAKAAFNGRQYRCKITDSQKRVIYTNAVKLTVTKQAAASSSVPTETAGTGIWIPTNGGAKYHSSSSCSNMIDPVEVTLDEAIRLGFTACKRCH